MVGKFNKVQRNGLFGLRWFHYWGGNMGYGTRVIVTLVSVGVLAVSGVAAASAYPASCASAQVCVYDNINYSTQLGWRSEGFALQDISSGNNDKVSSWSNHTGTNAAW